MLRNYSQAVSSEDRSLSFALSVEPVCSASYVLVRRSLYVNNAPTLRIPTAGVRVPRRARARRSDAVVASSDNSFNHLTTSTRYLRGYAAVADVNGKTLFNIPNLRSLQM
ncbi:hypothetical protein EVAR_95587_1 [Eumeta japonica]|uniref:Uncharacterized protein n=1 Tax=Eumeta variegata TaxID=151549 RepID=A0A4C1VIP4_EUMVA|nr:hypothetical protein EVAR_95587_1 [Eumeta japonica]